MNLNFVLNFFWPQIMLLSSNHSANILNSDRMLLFLPKMCRKMEAYAVPPAHFSLFMSSILCVFVWSYWASWTQFRACSLAEQLLIRIHTG